MISYKENNSNIRYFDGFLALQDPSLLSLLLKDKTTQRNITWATDSYVAMGDCFTSENEIVPEQISQSNISIIQPRVLKAMAVQAARTKKRAEVFTPAWICNQMNNYCDEEWFGRKHVFNKQDGCTWVASENPIVFPKDKTWKDYVDSKRLEITCGEAPFLVSRYDTSTGEIIDISQRIGVLDRKLRVVNENTNTEEEWMFWTIRAIQSVYGYEYQGDNLIIARINILMTFVDYLQDRWHREPTKNELKKVANIVAWNLWQMDGLKGVVPFLPNNHKNLCQVCMFDDDNVVAADTEFRCKIKDWKGKRTVLYTELMKGK